MGRPQGEPPHAGHTYAGHTRGLLLLWLHHEWQAPCGARWGGGLPPPTAWAPPSGNGWPRGSRQATARGLAAELTCWPAARPPPPPPSAHGALQGARCCTQPPLPPRPAHGWGAVGRARRTRGLRPARTGRGERGGRPPAAGGGRACSRRAWRPAVGGGAGSSETTLQGCGTPWHAVGWAGPAGELPARARLARAPPSGRTHLLQGCNVLRGGQHPAPRPLRLVGRHLCPQRAHGLRHVRGLLRQVVSALPGVRPRGTHGQFHCQDPTGSFVLRSVRHLGGKWAWAAACSPLRCTAAAAGHGRLCVGCCCRQGSHPGTSPLRQQVKPC